MREAVGGTDGAHDATRCQQIENSCFWTLTKFFLYKKIYMRRHRNAEGVAER